MEKPNAQIGAGIKFLGAELVGACDHRKIGDDKFRDIVLVKQINTEAEDTGITIKDLAKSIASSINKITGKNNEKEPDINWPDGVDKIVDALTVYIKEVYLKVARETDADTSVEYALWIGIKLDDEKKKKLKEIPPFDLIQLEELYLKIWKTDNAKILEEMKIVDFDKLPAPA